MTFLCGQKRKRSCHSSHVNDFHPRTPPISITSLQSTDVAEENERKRRRTDSPEKLLSCKVQKSSSSSSQEDQTPVQIHKKSSEGKSSGHLRMCGLLSWSSSVWSRVHYIKFYKYKYILKSTLKVSITVCCILKCPPYQYCAGSFSRCIELLNIGICLFHLKHYTRVCQCLTFHISCNYSSFNRWHSGPVWTRQGDWRGRIWQRLWREALGGWPWGEQSL